jgi:RNA-directed DNA polymerase
MNRSAKGGAGRACTMEAKAFSFTPPYQGVCGWHGTEEQRVTSGGLAWSPVGTGGSEPISEERNGERCCVTRYADDWVVTCKSAAEARAAVAAAQRILNELGVQMHPQKTRIVHVEHGFEFLGYKIKRGKRLRLPPGKIRSSAQSGALYAFPREKSIRRFMDQVRQSTRRRVPLKTRELIEQLNPVLRGWGHYYKRAHVRLLFNRLDRWIVRRIWSHRYKRWRCAGWKSLPAAKLYGEFGLVNLVGLIPSIASQTTAPS